MGESRERIPQALIVDSAASSLTHSPLVSPLAEHPKLDRIPIALWVRKPRLRSTGFKRPADRENRGFLLPSQGGLNPLR